MKTVIVQTIIKSGYTDTLIHLNTRKTRKTRKTGFAPLALPSDALDALDLTKPKTRC